MYIERDIENNQFYLSFSDGVTEGVVAETAEVLPGIYADLDRAGNLVGIDIANTKEVIGAAAAELTLSGELVGVKEAAQIVGKDRGNFLRDLASRQDFPNPVARVASGPLWFSKDIERHLQRRRASSIPYWGAYERAAAESGVLEQVVAGMDAVVEEEVGGGADADQYEEVVEEDDRQEEDKVDVDNKTTRHRDR